jgi:hypothetical protein
MLIGVHRGKHLLAFVSAVSLALSTFVVAGERDDEGWHSQHHRRALPAATIAARQHFFGLDNVDARTGEVRDDRVIFTWTGVSGFAASFKGHVVLMDQYIARDGGARVNGNPSASTWRGRRWRWRQRLPPNQTVSDPSCGSSLIPAITCGPSRSTLTLRLGGRHARS